MLSIKDFRYLVPDKQLANIYAKAKYLYGKHIVHINSTYQGGGVAEILYSLVPLLNDVGIDAGWRILHGSGDFFEVTKKFHNALQGADLNLTEQKIQLYEQVNENFSHITHLNHDCVIVHDPQPLPLIRFYCKKQPWIWRCHIDLTHPHTGLWDYLKSFLLKYDEAIMSSDKYVQKDLPISSRIIRPAINPLNHKNKELSQKTILKYITKAGLPTDKPIITQVSRLDPWKDPEGVLDVFRLVKEKIDCRLVFCYNLASDDPEGMEMHDKVYRKAKKLIESGDVYFVVGNNEILVNSLQRFSRLIIQKSIKEGFCLAVTEGLWKGTPVVASNVGGIPSQITDGESGYLLEPHDHAGFAERIIHLLRHPDEAQHMGVQGREYIRSHFLITRLLLDYLDLMNDVLGNNENN